MPPYLKLLYTHLQISSYLDQVYTFILSPLQSLIYCEEGYPTTWSSKIPWNMTPQHYKTCSID